MRELDAVVLAGEKKDSIPVLGANKAFLPFQETTILGKVIEALDRARSIGSITVVGPRDKLEAELGRAQTEKPLRLVEQGDNIYQNIIAGALSAFPQYRPGMSARDLAVAGGVDREKAAVMFTADMPMIDPREIDHFIATAPLDRADIIYGFTHLETLAPFEPREGKPGIKFIYGCAADRVMRHSNIALYRPLKLSPATDDYAQIIYSLRYQRYFGNVLRGLVQVFRRALKPRILFLFVMIELASWLHNRGHFRLRDIVRRPLTIPFADSVVSELFQTPFATHMTIGPGLTLDVDDEQSYQAFLAMIEEWKAIQDRQISEALASS